MQELSAVLAKLKVMPIGADLVLKEKANHSEILKDGKKLAAVLVEGANRFKAPLAMPVMDLTLEKHAICSLLGVAAADEAHFHFSEPFEEGKAEELINSFDPANIERMKVITDAISTVTEWDDNISVGMSIGPFSLATKLLSDPITPIYMLGMGIAGEEEPAVRLVEQTLAISKAFVLKYLEAQLKAGAKVIFIAEPAANTVYISPKQIGSGSDIFERVAMDALRDVDRLIKQYGASLFFHCCGELTPQMVSAFASLKPALMSLGSSRILWEDAALVDKGTILFGNLPSKKFYSNAEISVDEVYAKSLELLEKMKETGHPYILGSECDVLSVPGCEEVIMSKVKAMMKAAADYYGN